MSIFFLFIVSVSLLKKKKKTKSFSSICKPRDQTSSTSPQASSSSPFPSLPFSLPLHFFTPLSEQLLPFLLLIKLRMVTAAAALVNTTISDETGEEWAARMPPFLHLLVDIDAASFLPWMAVTVSPCWSNFQSTFPKKSLSQFSLSLSASFWLR